MKKRKGFTLIELIAAIAILSIGIVGICNAMFSGTKISTKNTKKVNTSVYAQYAIQTYKSQGKKYLQTTYNCTSTPFTGYFYFNNTDDLGTIISDPSKYTKGNYTAMVSGAPASAKSFGAYVEMTTITDLGTDHATPSKNVTCMFDTVRISVQVVNSTDALNNSSSLVFFVGR